MVLVLVPTYMLQFVRFGLITHVCIMCGILLRRMDFVAQSRALNLAWGRFVKERKTGIFYTVFSSRCRFSLQTHSHKCFVHFLRFIKWPEAVCITLRQLTMWDRDGSQTLL